MRTKEDVLKDPRPGDVVLVEEVVEVTVLERDGKGLLIRINQPDIYNPPEIHSITASRWLWQWKTDYHNAEVVTIAQGDE